MTAATQIKKLDRSYLVDILNHRLGWSESHLRGFSDKSLNELYEYVQDGYLVTKAKTRTDSYLVYFRLPKKVTEALDISYGDYFDCKYHSEKKLITLHRGKNKIKVRSNMMIALPYSLVNSNVLVASDDMLMLVKDDRIILKSFSYMQ
ncbi:hypothetical protein [Bacillus sp. UMB0728]|uniref:hypothetical protein n=1 Tax=Bacillus sp. UMB0728 TaxID=2066052 RepID=UPI000C75F9AB|nr:hypothetical protein [Bacillus sp. UMB0728]PLR72161.1 hypothetical protein CYJ37_11435 [Bacillus sp. UMB0728]